MLRPAHLGLIVSFAIVAALLILPARNVEEGGEPSELPPSLYPAYSDEEGLPAIRRSPLLIRRVPESKEVTKGTSFHFSLSVENTGEETLENLTVEERYDARALKVIEAEGGEQEPNLLTWEIAELTPQDVWLATYTVEVLPTAPPGDHETTVYVRGEELEGTTSASRMVTSVLSIIPLPTAGVEVVRSRLQPGRVLAGGSSHGVRTPPRKPGG